MNLKILLISILAFYLIWLYQKNKTTDKQALKILREFTQHGLRTNTWLKEHFDELQMNPMATFNHPEFVKLINEDQELYERVVKEYPDYPNTVMAPIEFRQYLIEIAQGYYKKTH